MVADVTGSGPLRTAAGIASIYFGTGAIAGSIDFASPPANTAFILGAHAGDITGDEVWKGDVNHDGIEDILLCAQDTDGPDGTRTGAGSLYILFGHSGFSGTVDLLTPPGWVTQIHGARSEDRLGIWVRSGDLNGDGIDDVLVGADGADGPGNARANCGAAYIIFGATTWSAVIDLASPPPGIVTFHGVDPQDRFGSTLNVGDINGDGRLDVLVGSALNRSGASVEGGPPSGAGDGPSNDRPDAGEAAIFFNPGVWPSVIDAAAPPSSVSETIIYGAAFSDYLGEEIFASDIDQDGTDELLLGALAASPLGRTAAGAGFILKGGKLLENRRIDMASPPGDVQITRILGRAPADILSDTMLAADVDKDGYPDVLMGSPLADAGLDFDTGKVDILFGRPEPYPAIIDLASPPPHVRMAFIIGAEAADILAYSMDAGDWDNDGFADVMPNAMGAGGQGNLITRAGDVEIVSGAMLAALAPSFTITQTPTITETPTITPTPSNTPTITETGTPTLSPTETLTPTITETPTVTAPSPPTETNTNTSTAWPTGTPSHTQAATLTATLTETSTPSLTTTLTGTSTPTSTPTAQSTDTASPTATPSATPSVTADVPTLTPSQTPTRSADFNGDGRVDEKDLIYLLELLGTELR
jgi:hypothetical protein